MCLPMYLIFPSGDICLFKLVCIQTFHQTEAEKPRSGVTGRDHNFIFVSSQWGKIMQCHRSRGVDLAVFAASISRLPSVDTNDFMSLSCCM